MRILFFTHYFPPEGNAPASRTYEHCTRWVKAGHEVTVITCVPNVPSGVPYDGYRNRWRTQREDVDGIEVLRVWTWLAPNAGFVRRILNYLTYMLTATWQGLCTTRPNVIVATSPQFFCGWAGVLVQFFRRVPFVLEVRDLWPESILTVGAMKRGFVIRFLEWLERRMYAAADHIVTVGQGYREHIAPKVDSNKPISVIYNGVDSGRFQPESPHEDLVRDYGMAGRFVCTYAGTIGMAHGLETVIEAADRLQKLGRDDIGFLLVGDGACRCELEELAQERRLTNVRFAGRLDKSQMPKVIASSDAILVHLRDCELFSTVIPSKIFEAMAMGKPIVMGVRGESADIVREANAGIDMTPGDADSLVACVCRLADDRTFRESLSRDGREFVLQQYNRDRFAGEMLQLLEAVAK